jgi:hypothetical protein
VSKGEQGQIPWGGQQAMQVAAAALGGTCTVLLVSELSGVRKMLTAAAGLSVALAFWFIARWSNKRDNRRREEATARLELLPVATIETQEDRRRHFSRHQEKWKDDLGKEEKCPAIDCKSKGYQIPRRQFYRSLDGGKILLPMLCDHCFKRLFGVWPQIQHQHLRVWRDNLPCSVPSCSEDAVGLGADNNPYCTGHMHKGGPSKNAVIT